MACRGFTDDLDLTHLPIGIGERAFDGTGDRIRQVRAANWVGYARATRALDRLEELEHPPCARMPCLLLYGESGMGKTMIVEKFQRMHPPTFHRSSGAEHRPVVILQMPSGPDDRRFSPASSMSWGYRIARTGASMPWSEPLWIPWVLQKHKS